PATEHPDREARDAAMGDWVESMDADLVVLAGYMQLLSPGFVARFRHRVVNVHPALLPAFPGLDEGVDTGPLIVQRPVPIPASRDRAQLEEAIHALEHELYPEAIRMIARGL